MILIDTEIEALITAQNLLTDHDIVKIKNCAYNLRVGKVFQPRTGEEELLAPVGATKKVVWEIGPSETLVVKTKESVNMPNNLCATYAPLYRLSKRGIMLLNASIVEPGYEGPLSCFLVNFSSENVTLQPDQEIAKIIFHRLTHPPGTLIPSQFGSPQYEQMLSISAKKFHKSFMDITGIEERASDKAKAGVRNWLIIGGVFIAFLLTWASLEPLISKWLWEKTGVASSTQRMEDAKLLNNFENAKKELEKELENVKLKAEIEELKVEIEKLKNKK